MANADSRRAVLRELIRTRYHGVARHLALAAGKPEGQINDMLSSPPRKSFGEKVARQMEEKLNLPAGYFDQPEGRQTSEASGISEARTTIYEVKAQAPSANQLTDIERDLIAGFHAAPLDTQAFWINQARYYIESKRGFSVRSEKQ